MCSPNRVQIRYVFAIDLLKRRVVLVEEVPPVFQPAAGRRRPQFLIGKGGARSDRGIRADFHESRRICRLLRMKHRPSGEQGDNKHKE